MGTGSDFPRLELSLVHGGSALIVVLIICERRNTMNSYFKTLLLLAAIAGLYVPAVAVAQKSAGGVVGEARLHPGTWNNQRSSRSFTGSRPGYRSTAPMIVRTESAPNAVAQAPAERRSYSYEPSQQAASGHCGCGSNIATEPAPATAQRLTETRRSFSYEPSTSESSAAPQSYSAPRMRSSQSSRTPKYLLPKTDPNKYRN